MSEPLDMEGVEIISKENEEEIAFQLMAVAPVVYFDHFVT